MLRRVKPAENFCDVEVSSPQQLVNAPAIGKLRALTGSVTVKRADNVAPAAAGDSLYQGDVIETGGDGTVTILFADGTAFHLYPSTVMVLDEFVCSPETSSKSAALFRILKGMFALFAGKLSRPVTIETPFGQIRSVAPGAGFATLAFGILTFSLIDEVRAASIVRNLQTDGEIDLNYLRHGAFEVRLFNGDVYIMDDVTKTLWVHAGSSELLTNSLIQLAESHRDYLTADDVHSRMLNDPTFQQWQHAFAQPTTGPGGSSTSASILGFNSGPTGGSQGPIGGGGISTGNGTGGSSGGSSGTGNINIIPPPPSLPSQVVVWTSPAVTGHPSDLFVIGANWNTGSTPSTSQTAEILLVPGGATPLIVQLAASGSIGGLIIGAGVILQITNDATLTVANGIQNAGMIEFVDPPILSINGPVFLNGGGIVAMPGPTPASTDNTLNQIIATKTGSTLVNVDNTIIGGNATIGKGDGALTLVNQAGGTIDATPVTPTPSPNNTSDGVIVLNTGNAIINAGLLEATAGGTLDVKDGEINNSGTGSLGIAIDGTSKLVVDVPSLGALQLTGGGQVALDGGTITGASSSNELENVNNAIVGSGTISHLTLVNDLAGTIDASGGTLVFSTTNTIQNAGLLEATAGGTLEIDDNVINTGKLLATAGGELDVRASTISDNNGGTEQIDTGSELLVDTMHLTLNGDGSGKVVLSGTALITGASSSDVLENFNKTIVGAGTISSLVLVNDAAGTIEASGGALILDTSHAISNAGLMEAATGGTLHIEDNVSNSGVVTALNGGTVELVNNTVSGGQVMVEGGGELVIVAAASATLDGVTVTDNSTLVAGGIEVVSGATLTLDDGTVINSTVSGTLVIDAGSQVTVTTGGATLNNIIVDDDATGTGASAGIVVTGAVLTLTGGTQIDGGGSPDNPAGASGTLTVGGGGELLVTGAATLDGVAVGNGGSGIVVSGATLTLDDKTVISGSTLTVASAVGSELVVTAGSGTDGASAGGATLDHVAVTDSNATGIDVTSGVLTLDDGTSVAGGGGLAVESGGQLVVTSGGATLNNIIVDDDATGTGASAGIVVTGAVLTLTGGTQIDGGGSPDNPAGASGTLTVGGGGELLVTGAATLDGVAVGNGGSGIVVSGATLTLDDKTVISGSTLTVASAVGSELVVTAGSGTDGASAGGATLDHVAVTDSNATGIDVTSGVLTLDDGTSVAGGGGLAVESGGQLVVTSGGATLNNIIVDDDATGTGASAGIVVTGAVLTLTGGTQIDGGGSPDNPAGASGTLTVGGGGELLVTGPATLDGVAVGNGGSGIVVSGASLTLNDKTVISGSTLTVASAVGSQLLITTGGNTDGATAGGATLTGVTVTDNNTSGSGGIEVSSGKLTLNGGTDILSTVSGTLVVDAGSQVAITTGGAIFDGLLVDEDTTAGGILAGIDVASGSTLTLKDNTQIQGGGTGTLNIEGTGLLSITTLGGATLDGVKVTDTNTTNGIDVASGAVLTLNDNTQLIGGGAGTMTIEGTGQLLVTAGSGADSATAGGATLDGMIVTDSSTLDAGGIEVSSGATLTLKDGTQIEGGSSGTLVIDSGGQLAITSAGGATLDGVIVDDDTTASGALVGIDVTSGSTLTLDDATQIWGGGSGTLTIESGAVLSITTASGATLDGLLVTDNNTTANGIDVVSLLTLTDGTVISGGTMTVESSGDIQVTAGIGVDGATPGGATIQGVTVADNGTSNLTVASGTLTLNDDFFSGGVIVITVDSGATLILNHTTILDAIVITEAGGNLIVSADSTIQTISSTLSGNNVVEFGATLTLIDETVTGTIDDQGTVLIASGTFGAIFNGVLVDDDTATTSPPGIEIASGATLTLENNSQIYGGGSGTLIIDNGGQLAITTAGGATLDGVMVSDNNTVDGIDVGPGAVLTLNDGTVISGGTMTVESTGVLLITAGSGSEAFEGASDPVADTPSARNATLTGVTVTDSSTGIAGSGGIEVSGGVLTLNGGSDIVSTVSGSLVIDSGSQLLINGAATLDGLIVDDDTTSVGTPGIDVSGATLTLKDNTQIQGGSTGGAGSAGTITIESAGQVLVSSGGAGLDGVFVTDANNATTGIDVSGGKLTLSDGTVISGGTMTVESTANSTVVVTAGSHADSATASGATLTNVTVTDSSTGIAGSGGIEVSGGVLTLNGGSDIVSTVSGSLVIDSGSQLLINGAATLDGLIVDDDTTSVGTPGIDVSGATLTLKDNTQIQGGSTGVAGSAGTITIESAGQVLVSSGGAGLDGVFVTDANNATTGIDVSGGKLTLSDGTVISGGTMTVESTANSTVVVTAGSHADSATASGATLTNVTVTDSSTGIAGSGGIEVSGGVLTLNGGSDIVSTVSGSLVIDSGSQLLVNGAATLDGLIVDDDTTSVGTPGIDVSGATLTLKDNTQIQGGSTGGAGSAGTITIESAGQVLVSSGGAGLDGVFVTDANNATTGIDVSGGKLTLSDGTVISGGTMTVESTANSTVVVTAGSHADSATASGATLTNVTVTDSSTGIAGSGGIEVSGGVLTLNGGSDIVSTVSSSLVIDSGSQLLINGAATLDGLIVDDDTTSVGTPGIDVSGATLTLKDNTQIQGGSTGGAGSAGTITIESAGQVLVSSGGAGLDGVFVTDANNATTGIDVSGGKLTLSDGTVISGGTMTVESTANSTVVVTAGSHADSATASGATLTNVTVTDSSTGIAGSGGIEVSGGVLTLNGGSDIVSTVSGSLVIDSGSQLLVNGAATLDGLIVDDDTTSVGTPGIDVSGATLTLTDNTQIQGGFTGVAGSAGTITIESAGQVLVSSGGAGLDGVFVTDANNATTGIDVSGGKLTLSDGTVISGGTMTVESTANSTVVVTAGSHADSATASGATLTNVTVTDSSTGIAGSGGIEVSGGVLTLNGGSDIVSTVSGSLVIDSGSQLLVNGAATLDGLIVDDDTTSVGTPGIDVSGATLTLKDNTQIQGGSTGGAGSAGTITIESAGQVLVSSGGAGLDGVFVTDANNATTGIDVSGGKLTLSDGTVISGGTMTVESTANSTVVVTAGSHADSATASGATLTNVTVTDSSTGIAGSGGIEVSGGVLTLNGGSDIVSTVSGSLVIDSGSQLLINGAATLDGLIVDDDTTSVGTPGIDVSGATLTLKDNTQIQGGSTGGAGSAGTITIESAGQVLVSSGGAGLDGVFVTDANNATTGIDVSGGKLTLSDGTVISGGTMTVESTANSTVVVTAGSHADSATASGATLTNVTVTDSSTGIAGSGGIEVSGGVLTLNGGSDIVSTVSGSLVIDSGSQLLVNGAATLDGLIVDDDTTSVGTPGIDVSGATLTLTDNTQIQGGFTGVAGSAGTITIESAGQVLVSSGGAGLDGVFVTDANNATTGIDVSGGKLTLSDGTVISGGTMTVESTANSTVVVTAGSHADSATASGATLTNVTVTDSSTGIAGSGGIEVSGGVLTLNGGSDIVSTVSGSLVIDSGSQLLVNGAATLDGLIVDDDTTSVGTPGIDVSGATLTLKDNTQIQGGSTGVAGSAGTITIESAGQVLVSSGGAGLDGVFVTDANNATTGIDVSGGKLTLSDGTVISGGTMTVESTANSTVVVTAGSHADSATASGATLTNVTVTDSSTGIAGSGGIEVSGGVLTLNGGSDIVSTVSGSLVIDSGSQLLVNGAATLDGLIVDDDTTSVGTPGIDVSGATLTLKDNTQIQGGSTGGAGSAGTITIESAGQVLVSSGGAGLDGVFVTDANNATTGIDVSGGKLTLSDGTVISGGTMTVESTANSTVVVTAGSGADSASARNATLDHVAVTDSNATGIDVTSGVLTLDDGTSVAGGGGLAVESGGQLVVTSGGATLNNIIVDDDATGTGASAGIVVTGAVLTLTGGTQIDGGGSPDNPAGASGTLTVGGGGELLVTGPATLDGVAVGNGGSGIVVSGASLTLNDKTVISGSTLTVASAVGSQLLITTGGNTDGATAGGATLTGVTVTDNNTSGSGGIEVSSGKLTLNGGTDILSTVSGTLVVDAGSQVAITTGGAIFDGLLVDDDTTSGSPGIDISGGVLTLKDGTQIQGGSTGGAGSAGTITIESAVGSQLLVSAGGAGLDGVSVTDANASKGIDVSGGMLTLSDGTVISGGTMTIESTSNSALVITAGDGGDSATARNATLTGVTVTDSSTGISGSGGIEVSGGVLTLNGGADIVGSGTGTLVIDAGSQVAVTTGGAIFDGLLVDDDTTGGSPGIDVSGGVLTLKDGTQVQGGSTGAIAGTLTIENTAGSQLLVSSGGAGLDGVFVTDANATKGIDISGGVLTLSDGTVISGGTMTIESTSNSALVITAGGGDDSATARNATLTGVTVADNNRIEVSGGVLTLNSGSQINSSASGTVAIDSGATLDLVGATVFGGIITIAGLLDSTGISALTGAAITIGATGTLEATSGTLTIASGSLSNAGTLEANGGTLDLETTVTGAGSILVLTSGILEIDANQTRNVSFASDPTGILKFDSPFGFTFTGTISGLILKDVIDLANINDVQGATVNGTVLTVKTLHEGTLTYNISALPLGEGFAISSDGNGGTDLTVAVVADFEIIGDNQPTLNLSSQSNKTVLIEGTNDTVNFSQGGNDSNTITVINEGPGTDTVTFNQGNNQSNIIDLSGSAPTSTNVVDFAQGNSNTNLVILSPGTDIITFSSQGNNTNTVDGVIGPNATLNSSDQLTGGNGIDTLVISGTGTFDLNSLAVFANFENVNLTSPGETLTLKSGQNPAVNFAAGDDPVTLGGSGTAGTISGYETINSYTVAATVAAAEKLGYAGVAIAANAGTTTGTHASTLQLHNGAVVTTDQISNGIITFNSNTSLTSLSDVAAVIQYLESNSGQSGVDGTTGQAVAFTATIGGVVNTFIYIRGSTSANDVVIDLTHVSVTSLSTSGLTNQLAVLGALAPAGTAGEPINLALSNPPAANGGPVTVTISGMPADWQLNQGTNLGNGTWMVETNDLTALTVLTAAAYAGAMLLNVTESWVNADGTIGTATVADNVEAYAPNSPIFALANIDTLTGAGGNDLFVFEQPISNDVIYNFNALSDKVDLVGFDNVSSVNDLQIADDANGNAVITIGSGETITLYGVDAASLTASNFVFDQTPTLNNSGTMMISDGAELPLAGIINNSGIIELNATGDLTDLVILGDGASLEGGGQVILSGTGAMIVGSNSTTTLSNVDNTVSGVGQIGSGDGTLTLINETHGTIEANDAGAILILDTGHTIANAGILEATNGGTLQIDDSVTGTGTAVIAGGTLIFEQQCHIDVIFDNGQTGSSYGELVLTDPSGFFGHIMGFDGTAPDMTHSDAIDLFGINFNSGQFSETYDASTGLLTVSDGTNTCSLTFDGFTGTFGFAADASGTGLLITDPPSVSSSTVQVDSYSVNNDVGGTVTLADIDSTDQPTASVTPEGSDYVGNFKLDPITDNGGNASLGFEFTLGDDQIDLATGQTLTQSYDISVTDAQNPAENFNQTVSVSIGGPGNDNFVFQPGIGADTIVNFNPQNDTIELDHFANAQTVQQLEALITTDAHADAVINLGHNDSITLAGTSATELQQLIQAGHVLLH